MRARARARAPACVRVCVFAHMDEWDVYQENLLEYLDRQAYDRPTCVFH